MVAVPGTTAWVTSWTMPVTAVTGADGDAAWGARSVLAGGVGTLAARALAAGALAAGALAAGAGAAGAGELTAGAGALAAGAGMLPAEAAVPLVVWLAGAGWAVGCAAATVPWTAWAALWTTPPTAEATVGESAVWVAVPAPVAVVVAEAGALAAGALGAGVLAAEVLGAVPLAVGALAAGEPAGGVLDAGVLGCDPLADRWAALPADPAVGPVEEATDDTAEEADDTTSPAA